MTSESLVDARCRCHRPILVSTYCTGGQCVGVRLAPQGVEVVDTKDVNGPSLHFTPEEWAAFLAGAKSGEFDVPTA